MFSQIANEAAQEHMEAWGTHLMALIAGVKDAHQDYINHARVACKVLNDQATLSPLEMIQKYGNAEDRALLQEANALQLIPVMA